MPIVWNTERRPNQADKIDRGENSATILCRSKFENRAKLMPLKILNRALVFLGCRLCLEGFQIPALPCLRIFLPRIQPIFTGP